MKKKGISPLIATVLILGFTVALAAVIMTWGMDFVEKMQESTEETANVKVICATDVVFDIKNVCDTGTDGPYKITIANNGNIDIDKFTVRFYKTASDVEAVNDVPFATGGAGITKFGIESDLTSNPTLADIKMIEAIPVITLGGESITCVQNVDTFGNLDGAKISACT